MNNLRKQKGGQLNSTVKVAVQNIFDEGRDRTRSHTKIHVDEFKNVLTDARQRRKCRNKHCRMAHCHSKRMLVTRLGTGFDEGSSTWTKEPTSKEPCATFNFTSELHFSRCKNAKGMSLCRCWHAVPEAGGTSCLWWCVHGALTLIIHFLQFSWIKQHALWKARWPTEQATFMKLIFFIEPPVAETTLVAIIFAQGSGQDWFFYNLSLSVPLIRCHFTASPESKNARFVALIPVLGLL